MTLSEQQQLLVWARANGVSRLSLYGDDIDVSFYPAVSVEDAVNSTATGTSTAKRVPTTVDDMLGLDLEKDG